MSYEKPKIICSIDTVLLDSLLNRLLNSRDAFKTIVAFTPQTKTWHVAISKFPDTAMQIDPETIGKLHEMETLAKNLAAKLIDVLTGKHK